jgi:hypothetical protein
VHQIRLVFVPIHSSLKLLQIPKGRGVIRFIVSPLEMGRRSLLVRYFPLAAKSPKGLVAVGRMLENQRLSGDISSSSIVLNGLLKLT